MRMRHLGTAVLLSGSVFMAHADPALPIEVGSLDFAPQTDGVLTEWQAHKPYSISITPAVDDDKKNYTGEIDVELWVGVRDDVVHVAARWPDKKADTNFRPWEWRGKKYRHQKDCRCLIGHR